MLMALDILVKRVYLARIDKGHQAWYRWIKKGRWDATFLLVLSFVSSMQNLRVSSWNTCRYSNVHNGYDNVERFMMAPGKSQMAAIRDMQQQWKSDAVASSQVTDNGRPLLLQYRHGDVRYWDTENGMGIANILLFIQPLSIETFRGIATSDKDCVSPSQGLQLNLKNIGMDWSNLDALLTLENLLKCSFESH